MAESAPVGSAATEVAGSDGTQPAVASRGRHANPALQPLDSRPMRHVHHGQTGAMWTATIFIFIGFLVGAIGLVMRTNWALFVIGAAICVVGIAAGLVMQAMGFGLYEKKKR